ncbi:DUF3566 domain-containing protein [Nocardia callitridis]|uniref:DUF3566 domain-containing protein n=1 Tax=Nocardia callitridis TaxID=648753 RepID=A0ABP9JZK1_9NOCA
MTTPNQPNDERHQTNGVTERVAPSAIPPRPIPRPSNSADNGHGGPQSQQGAQGGGQPQGNGPQGGGSQGNPQGNGPQGGRPGNPSNERHDQGPGDNHDSQRPTVWSSNEQDSSDAGQQSQPGKPASSPYQDGWSQLPQREPQSNLYRPGHSPVSGRSTSGGGLGGGANGGGGANSGGGLSGGANGGGGLGGAVSNARTPADLAAKAARKEAAMVKSVGIDGPTRSIARPELVKDMPDLSEIRHPLPQHPEPTHNQQGHISPTVPVAVAAAVTSGEPLRATVQIRRIDPWSTLKITLVISVAMFFVWMLAVGLLYIVLAGMGVWDRLNSTFTDMVAGDAGSSGLITASTVFGYAGVVGLINVVLFTALGTVGTFIYNQCCDLVGGIQVTLADPD